MRRIIERVVTVVTTTTWTISWQKDPPLSDPEAGPAGESPTPPDEADTPGNHLLSVNRSKEAEISQSNAESDIPENETSDTSKNNPRKRKEKRS